MLSFELFEFFYTIVYMLDGSVGVWIPRSPTNQHYKKKPSPWNHEEIQSASVVDQGHELSPIHRSKRTEEAPGKGEISDGNS